MANGTRAGVVLAGGYSTRFGAREKALAKLDGQSLLAHAVDGLAPVVDGVIVNCRRDQATEFRTVLKSTTADVAFVCDPTPGRGPAAGLATALAAVAAPNVALVACDMPFIDATFLDWLFEAMGDAAGAVPHVENNPQPTHAVFATERTRRAARDAVTNGSGSLRDVLEQLDTVEIPDSRVLEETSKESFTDINTPAALETGITIDDGVRRHDRPN
jgi:molybdopterin-guanine dinucleotide biosynthesis protein A